MLLQQKVAVVTGASRGIGWAIAHRFATEGARVALVDILSDEVQTAAEDLAKATGAETAGYTADVSDHGAVESLVETAVGKFGRIDVLVNNAGITRDGLLLRMSPEDFDAVLNVNLKGAFNCTKHVARHMLRERSGAIINIASVIGLVGNPGQANYSASKGGLIAFTRTVARELASKKVRVNAIAPGFIRTEMTERIPEKAREQMIARIPLKDLGEPEDVANAALFLASDAAKYITGQVLVVDGGMTV